MIRTFAKKVATAALRPTGLELKRRNGHHQPATPDLPAVPSRGLSCAIVGTPQGGFAGPGKCTPDLFWPKFHYGMARQGVAVSYFGSLADFVRDHDGCTPTIAVLVYNEVREADYSTMERLEAALPDGVHVVNSARIGQIIREKSATNGHLSRRGVRMPRIVSRGAGSLIFSNDNLNSGASAHTLSAPEDGRYNTQFIDTRVPYRGSEYYTTVRALAVGKTCLSAYVRLRPAAEGEASVHAKNTPLDPALIDHVQRELVAPNMPAINEMCRQIADVLGVAFYSHDLLICRDTGQIYLCETGFKFDDFSFREQLWPISADLEGLRGHFSLDLATEAATVLLEEVTLAPAPPLRHLLDGEPRTGGVNVY